MRSAAEQTGVLATSHEINLRVSDSIAYPASGEGEERGGVALLDEVTTLDVVGGGDLEQGCKVVELMKSRNRKFK